MDLVSHLIQTLQLIAVVIDGRSHHRQPKLPGFLRIIPVNGGLQEAVIVLRQRLGVIGSRLQLILEFQQNVLMILNQLLQMAVEQLIRLLRPVGLEIMPVNRLKHLIALCREFSRFL